VFTGYVLSDLEWIKAPPTGPQPNQVEFLLRHGERQLNGRTVRYVPKLFAPPGAGERLLVFLTEILGRYSLASHGAESLFRIDGGRVMPVGRSLLSRKLAGAERSSLVTTLRGVAK